MPNTPWVLAAGGGGSQLMSYGSRTTEGPHHGLKTCLALSSGRGNTSEHLPPTNNDLGEHLASSAAKRNPSHRKGRRPSTHTELIPESIQQGVAPGWAHPPVPSGQGKEGAEHLSRFTVRSGSTVMGRAKATEGLGTHWLQGQVGTTARLLPQRLLHDGSRSDEKKCYKLLAPKPSYGNLRPVLKQN